MDTRVHPPRRLLSRLVLLVTGIVLGAAVATAHFSGLLTPIYHKLGWHSLHEAVTKEKSGMEHAGHGGIPMTQKGGGEPSKLPGYAMVQIAPERQQLIGVRTGKVQRDRLLMTVRAVGIIEPDQERLKRIHTRVSGWITKVYVNFVGQNVEKGAVLLELYSPDLYQTQLDYLLAMDSWEKQGKSDSQKRLVDAARQRLELWDVPEDEIAELNKTRKARDTLKLRSTVTGRVLERNVREGSYVDPAMELYKIADLSVLWLQAKIYEYELPHVELNQPVQISLLSQPGVKIQGKVSFIEPVVQEVTRTVKVRVVIDNPKDEFKPGMYADLVIDHDMGEGLLVPESAVLRTGERNLAFRVLPGSRFEPVEVTLGARFGDRYEVLSGLQKGEEIVTSAGFLIDAESRLKSATAGMAGHQHGTSSAPNQKSTPMKMDEDKNAPAEHKHDHGK
jgi:Cu(I)/Ag(I) efflux system membrane fusion protein